MEKEKKQKQKKEKKRTNLNLSALLHTLNRSIRNQHRTIKKSIDTIL